LKVLFYEFYKLLGMEPKGEVEHHRAFHPGVYLKEGLRMEDICEVVGGCEFVKLLCLWEF
jgi:hypothetical protein